MAVLPSVCHSASETAAPVVPGRYVRKPNMGAAVCIFHLKTNLRLCEPPGIGTPVRRDENVINAVRVSKALYRRRCELLAYGAHAIGV